MQQYSNLTVDNDTMTVTVGYFYVLPRVEFSSVHLRSVE